MDDEREFLHLISNHLATARLCVELCLELAEEGAGSVDSNKQLEAAILALGKATVAIEERRRLGADLPVGQSQNKAK